MRLGRAIIGAGLALAIDLWWTQEIVGRIGSQASRISFSCLVRAGTGNCQALWLAGLHQTNQIASLIFYAAIAFSVWSLASPDPLSKSPFAPDPTDRRDPKID